MDYVKKCIATMLEQGSDGLLLVAGNPPVIRVDGKGKVIDSTPTETAEITEFLSAALSLPN
ncbi:MAG: Tfp pilus assembly ATPase PilU, partial [Candidatus Krumholzibacteriia bacterium]